MAIKLFGRMVWYINRLFCVINAGVYNIFDVY